MKVTFEHNEKKHLFYMFSAACKPLNLNRKQRRHVMKTANKFNTLSESVDLKPAEIQLTKNLTQANIKAYERFLTEPLIEEDVVKNELEELHLNLSTALDKLEKQGDTNVTKK